MPQQVHICEELKQTRKRLSVTTRFGKITGGRALNGAAVFLGTLMPYTWRALCL